MIKQNQAAPKDLKFWTPKASRKEAGRRTNYEHQNFGYLLYISIRDYPPGNFRYSPDKAY